MPVEDPRAVAKTYLAKHNVEKIFEVSRQPEPALRAAFGRAQNSSEQTTGLL